MSDKIIIEKFNEGAEAYRSGKSLLEVLQPLIERDLNKPYDADLDNQHMSFTMGFVSGVLEDIRHLRHRCL